MTKNTGGPAFPVTHDDTPEHHQGMTLRDYFAGQALQGLLSADVDCEFTSENAAARSYKFADAMLAARMTDDELSRQVLP